MVGFAALAFVAAGGFSAEVTPAATATERFEKARDQAQAKFKELLSGPKKTRSKILFTARDYELLVRQNRRQLIPRILLRPVPPKPVSFTSVSTAVEGDAEGLRGFPFTTANGGEVKVAFGRVGGELALKLEDPPVSLDYDEARRAAEVSYKQKVPVLGDVALRARSSGDWSATFSTDVEDVGHVSGSFDQQMDWSLDLDTEYSAVRGFVPTVSYGAKQDGMRVKAQFAGPLPGKPNTHASYAVGNPAGQYAPADFVHECAVKLASESGMHSLEARGQYNRRLAKLPVRGSVACLTTIRRAALEGYVDFDRCQLLCRVPQGKVLVAMGLGGESSPKELEVQVGKVSAAARLVKDRPRLRLSFDSSAR